MSVVQSESTNLPPSFNWIKNDPAKHKYFYDGDRFLIAVPVKNNKTGKEYYDLATISIQCDDESFSMTWPNGESYDDWTWDCVEYFHIIEGTEPDDGKKYEG